MSRVPTDDSSQDTSHSDSKPVERRALLKSIAAAAAVALAGVATAGATEKLATAGATEDQYRDPLRPALPNPEMRLDLTRAALVIIDPQIDFLSPKGVSWKLFGESVEEHNTVANIGRLLNAAKRSGIPVAISPHYYYPYDHKWKFGGPLEMLMHEIGMFDRRSTVSLAGFEGSGADFMPEYKTYIEDGKTIIASPHKMYGPQQNDLALQLRKQRVDQVILGGMSANLCVESHLRHLLEEGFEVAVVRDSTASPKIPEGDGYLSFIINCRYIANALWTTDETVQRLHSRT